MLVRMCPFSQALAAIQAHKKLVMCLDGAHDVGFCQLQILFSQGTNQLLTFIHSKPDA